MSCRICNKSKCCCVKTVSVTGPRGPQGPKGATGQTGPKGNDGAGVYQVIEIPTQDPSTGVLYSTSAVTEAGDYLATLCIDTELTTEGVIELESRALKNGAVDTGNANYNYNTKSSSEKLGHTHSFKTTLAIGDTAGFQIQLAIATKVNKGTIVLSKISN